MPRVASGSPPERGAGPQRLRHRRDFVRLSGSRIKVVTEAFILQARPSEAPGTVVRVGFTASRKVGGAVVRNRARRRLKALAARVVAARARPGWDYVLVARGAAVSRPWSAMVGDLEAAFDRLDRAPAP